MKTQIEIRCSQDSDRKLAGRIRRWTEEVMVRLELEASPERLSIHVFHRTDELQRFFRQEKEALGVVGEGETEFIATHEAWRGYPRIHVCRERMEKLSDSLVQGAVQHELAHAILHGTPEFYTFRFSRQLVAVSEACGLEMPMLQQVIYLLSIALKDGEVVRRLAETGFQAGQIALLDYMLADTDAEHAVWDAIRALRPQRKIAVASFMKFLLPLESLAAMKCDAAHRLRQLWEQGYGWLTVGERRELTRFAVETVHKACRPFQDWLEQTAWSLITDRRL